MSVYIKKGLPFTASLYKLISLSLNKTTTAYPMVGSSNDGRDVMFFLSYQLFVASIIIILNSANTCGVNLKLKLSRIDFN